VPVLQAESLSPLSSLLAPSSFKTGLPSPSVRRRSTERREPPEFGVCVVVRSFAREGGRVIHAWPLRSSPPPAAPMLSIFQYLSSKNLRIN